jgi:thiol-disulfide isomerase/thioredoxin
VRRASRIAAVLALALALAGCTESAITPGDGTAAGDGQYSEWTPSERVVADFATVDADGKTVSSASLKGHIVVLNFWYAGCPPCRVEAPKLEAVHVANPTVEFYGVNTRDGAAEAEAFEKKFGVTYPTILDAANSDMLFAFASVKPANDTPTTIVLDAQGRVAARILGEVLDQSILQAMITRVVSESS